MEETVSSVAERVQAVLAYISEDYVGPKITISGVCKLAGVNRANLYQSHPNLLPVIKMLCSQRQGSKNGGEISKPEGNSSTNKEITKLRKQIRALALICAEKDLQLQVQADRLQHLERKDVLTQSSSRSRQNERQNLGIDRVRKE